VELEAGRLRLAPFGGRAGWFARQVTPGRLALLTLIIAAAAPRAWVESGPVLSPFRRSTGLPDPGCGMTRSMVALAHGDLAGSLFFHPLGVAVATLLAVVVLVDINPWRVRLSVAHPRLAPLCSSTALLAWLIHGPAPWIGLAAFFIVWLVRLPLFLAGVWVY
jgi:hypothetical protein